MKKQWMVGIVLLFCACATKEKLWRQSRQTNSTQQGKQIDQMKQYSHRSFGQQSEGSLKSYGFKLYPKGQVQFQEGNFSGELDSVIAYGNSFSLQRQFHLRQDDTLWHNREKEMTSSYQAIEEQVKEKKKHTWWWWPWLPLVIGLGWCIYLIKRERWFFG